MMSEMMSGEEMRDEHQQQPVRKTMMTTATSHERRLHRLAAQTVSRKYQRAAIRRAEYRRLKAIVPSVADKKSVSKV